MFQGSDEGERGRGQMDRCLNKEKVCAEIIYQKMSHLKTALTERGFSLNLNPSLGSNLE